MLHHHQQDTVFSIDRVRSELLASAPEVKLPDVCDQFDVPQASIFSTLQLLAVRFNWTP